MNVGVGLPNAVPGTDPGVVVEWAARAEVTGFSSLGVVDRVRYESLDPLVTLSAAAAVTTRLRLVTMVVIGPLRTTAVLAREAHTVNSISGGRFILGLAVGARRDDYEAAGIAHDARGRRFSEQLEDLRHHWARDDGPDVTAPGLLVGGSTDETFARVARWADGYVHGGGPPRTFARAADKVWTAWREFGREGSPRLWAQGYFALGDDEAAARGLDYMKDYYAFTGPFADKIAAGLLTTPQSIARFVRGYREAGCEEIVLLPAVGDLRQVDRLAEVLAAL